MKKFNSEIKLIAFDADDTLWANEGNYRRAERKFAQVLAPWSGEIKAIETLLDVVRMNLPLLGYGAKSFIVSMIECGIELSGGKLSNREVLKLVEIGKEVMQEEIELYPKVEEVLASLRQSYPLLLATKGDLKEQESKIERSGLKGHFDYIEVMSEKDSESYLNIIDKLNLSPGDFLMIGNSFKSDILPVLEIGGHAVYIPSETIWVYEVVEEIEHPNLIKLNSIDKVVQLFQ